MRLLAQNGRFEILSKNPQTPNNLRKAGTTIANMRHLKLLEAYGFLKK
jgi:hypothetical protein